MFYSNLLHLKKNCNDYENRPISCFIYMTCIGVNIGGMGGYDMHRRKHRGIGDMTCIGTNIGGMGGSCTSKFQ